MFQIGLGSSAGFYGINGSETGFVQDAKHDGEVHWVTFFESRKGETPCTRLWGADYSLETWWTRKQPRGLGQDNPDRKAALKHK